MVAPLIGTSASNAQAFSPRESAAGRLGPAERADLSVQALAGGEPVIRLAARHNVSRKFVYEQKAKASEALQETFTSLPDDQKVLFHLPVTRDWLRQFALAQVLIGHTSFRGVMEILDAVFDYGGISIGTIHNTIVDAVGKARRINDAQALSAIAVGARLGPATSVVQPDKNRVRKDRNDNPVKILEFFINTPQIRHKKEIG